MKNHKFFHPILLAAALTLGWGCSSSDDDGQGHAFVSTNQQPNWQVDMSDNQPYPQWTAPDPAQFDSKMIVMLRLQEELVPFSTDDDLMAVFVGDECRALSTRDGNDQKVFFVLNLHGHSNTSSEHFTLHYYSGGLKQLFTLSGNNKFLNEQNVGVESDFSPQLMDGSTKYSIKTKLTVALSNSGNLPPVSEHDRVAVFVGEDCRGVGIPGTPFTVFSNQTDEQGQVYYYNATQGGIYTAAKTVSLTGEQQSFIFE